MKNVYELPRASLVRLKLRAWELRLPRRRGEELEQWARLLDDLDSEQRDERQVVCKRWPLDDHSEIHFDVD